MPVGQALTDLLLSQMESVRFAYDLPGRIGTRKEISVQGQICAQEASWLPMPKEKVGFAPPPICIWGENSMLTNSVIKSVVQLSNIFSWLP